MSGLLRLRRTVGVVAVDRRAGRGRRRVRRGRRRRPSARRFATTTTVAAPTATTAPSWQSIVAQAKVPTLQVFDEPNDAQPATELPNPWVVDPDYPDQTVQQVFLVKEQRPDGWVKVLLPVRPERQHGMGARGRRRPHPEPVPHQGRARRAPHHRDQRRQRDLHGHHRGRREGHADAHRRVLPPRADQGHRPDHRVRTVRLRPVEPLGRARHVRGRRRGDRDPRQQRRVRARARTSRTAASASTTTPSPRCRSNSRSARRSTSSPDEHRQRQRDLRRLRSERSERRAVGSERLARPGSRRARQ